jgi:hypothetical protein
VAKISETQFANKAVQLWHLLGALNALKARLKERGLWRNLRAQDKRDAKLIREYFRTRHAASAIVDALSVQIEN